MTPSAHQPFLTKHPWFHVAFLPAAAATQPKPLSWRILTGAVAMAMSFLFRHDSSDARNLGRHRFRRTIRSAVLGERLGSDLVFGSRGWSSRNVVGVRETECLEITGKPLRVGDARVCCVVVVLLRLWVCCSFGWIVAFVDGVTVDPVDLVGHWYVEGFRWEVRIFFCCLLRWRRKRRKGRRKDRCRFVNLCHLSKVLSKDPLNLNKS